MVWVAERRYLSPGEAGSSDFRRDLGSLLGLIGCNVLGEGTAEEVGDLPVT